jgi:hypothetical protein
VAVRRRQREPTNSRLCSSSRPPVLPVKKSRSREVAWIRHSSFCDWGCGLAAQTRVESISGLTDSELSGRNRTTTSDGASPSTRE